MRKFSFEKMLIKLHDVFSNKVMGATAEIPKLTSTTTILDWSAWVWVKTLNFPDKEFEKTAQCRVQNQKKRETDYWT